MKQHLEILAEKYRKELKEQAKKDLIKLKEFLETAKPRFSIEERNEDNNWVLAYRARLLKIIGE